MRIVVTGGAGFIGSHIADAFLESGHDVLVVDDLSSGKEANIPKRATFAKIDIRNGEALGAALSAFKPQAISHQAAQTSVSVSTRESIRDAEINIIGSLHLLEHAAKLGVSHVVFASTGGAIYGEIPDGQKAKTDWAPSPLSPYACSKFAIENYLRYFAHARSLPFTVLRYANVYGPRQDPHGEAGVVAIFSQRLLAGEDIRVNARKQEGDDGCVRDYVYVEDVVRANMAALSGTALPSLVNVATGSATTTRELAHAIARAAGASATMGHGPKRDGDVEHSVLEPTPYSTAPITTLDSGIEKTVAWFRNRK